MQAAPVCSNICGERVTNRFCGAHPLLARGIFEERRQRASLRDECHALRGVLAVDRYVGRLECHRAKPSLSQDATYALLAPERKHPRCQWIHRRLRRHMGPCSLDWHAKPRTLRHGPKTDEHQPPACLHAATDISEGPDRVIEEHHAES